MTTRPKAVEVPQIPPPPPPAECTPAAIEAFATELSGLPSGFQALGNAGRARVLLDLKAEDTGTYQSLRAQALRCAHD